MSIIGNEILAGAAGQGGYFLDNSLRFRQSAGAYLTRSQNAGDQKTWTWSAWVKLGYLNNDQWLFGGYYATNNFTGITINLNSGIQIYQKNSNNTLYLVREAPIRRDYSSWYHFIIAYDSTQATSTDRIRFYVNGEQITTFASATWPDLDRNTWLNYNIASANIGRGLTTGNGQFDGYQTEINFIDGQALTADDFGEFDGTTGVWKPKEYQGTYGTNGFHLDGSGVTDSSGNSNNWTNNNLNLSTSSATTYDLMTDVPTLTDEYTGNYCTMNALNGVGTISDGNMTLLSTVANWQSRGGTIAVSSGKWYWEADVITVGSYMQVGMVGSDVFFQATDDIQEWPTGYGYYSYNGNKNHDGANSSYGATYTTGDLIGIALDLDAGTIEFYKNNVSQGVAFTGISGEFIPAFSVYGGSGKVTANFGQRPFAYTPPTGFKSLNTYNLPDSTIEDGSEHFDTVLYTGDGTAIGSGGNEISDLEFQPDFTWIKAINQTYSHELYDAVRGATNFWSSDQTDTEHTNSEGLTSFDADGFTLGSFIGVNQSSQPYVAWNWKGANGTVLNEEGSIDTTVSANTTAGISIFTYTGSGGASDTLGHGLGVAPEWVFVHDLSGATFTSCYHIGVDATSPANYLMRLNTTDARLSSSVYWNNTKPTASLVTIGTSSAINDTHNYVMYCFAPVEGFSSFGSYTGNGSADGPFIYTGFRPRWILIKLVSTSAGNWHILDTERDSYNLMINNLYPNRNLAESTSDHFRCDAVSNGFKLRTSSTQSNYSGQTFIYSAFAENPFKNSLAR